MAPTDRGAVAAANAKMKQLQATIDKLEELREDEATWGESDDW